MKNKQKNLIALKLGDKTPRRMARFAKIAVLFVLAIFLLEIWMMNRLSTDGNKIAQLKEAQQSLSLENQLLENQIAEVSALGYLDKKAAELGFTAIKNIEYIRPADLASRR